MKICRWCRWPQATVFPICTTSTSHLVVHSGQQYSTIPSGVLLNRMVSSGTTGVTTLAIDIGGTGLKASVLDSVGELTSNRVRSKTT